MSDPLTTRCTDCRKEFTEAEIAKANACPSCGTDSVPMNVANDITLKINWHELRILTIWADNWAKKFCREESRETLRSIIGMIRAQFPERGPLTMHEEFQEVADAFGDVTVTEAGETKVIRQRKPS